MESAQSIRAQLCQDEWVVSVDLSDAYFHLLVHPKFRKFLRVNVQGTSYQYRAMCFGLCTAPLIFTRVMKSIAAYLRTRSISIHMYLDDWLIRADSPERLRSDAQFVIDLVSRLGCMINVKKSELVPTQAFQFLGMLINLKSGLVRPTLEARAKIRTWCALLRQYRRTTARMYLSFLGVLSHAADFVPLGRLYTRPLQFYLQCFWNRQLGLEVVIVLQDAFFQHLAWWEDEGRLATGVPLTPPKPQLTMFTDASNSGWGAFMAGKTCAGKWSTRESTLHINCLEMLAVHYALQQFSDLVRFKVVVVMTDNTTVVSHIRKQGGTHSLSLCTQTLRLFELSASLGVTLQVRFIAGKRNVLADQGRPDPTGGVDAGTECVPSDPRQVSRTPVGLVCHSLDTPAAQVCVPVSRRSGMGHGRSVDQLGRDDSLRVSADDHDRPGAGEGAVVGGSAMPSSAQVAHTGMVLDPSGSPGRFPTEDSNLQEASTATQSSSVSHQSGRTEPTRVARIKAGLMEAGFSEEAAARAAKPQRQSSLSLYQSRWRIFCSWCNRREIDPYLSTVQQIADFLLFLFHVQGCVPTTVAGYRTAISQTRAPVDGLPIGLNPVLTNIIKNLRLEAPRTDNRVPEWELDVVLRALCEAPFEPPSWSSPEGRKFCTLKTVFLLALATGARRSELHALSRSARDLILSDTGVSLKTLPGFLAKNQIPGHDPGPFVVKALSPFTGRDSADHLLCPVRMLKYYLHFTKATGKSGPLFQKLTGNGYPKSQTISSWIKNLIRLIYDKKGLSVQGHAHEVRRLAASWAYFSGVSTAAIVEAGRWRSSSSFTSFYLADVVRQRDGFYRPVPCIAMRALCRV